MGAKSRYSPEVRERPVRMVFEHEPEHGSQRAAIQSIASKIGCSAETLRNWVRQVSFEVKNIGRDRICDFVEKWLTHSGLIENPTSPALRHQPGDDFAAFEIRGRIFVISEPWGDSSRYLITSLPPEPSADLEAIQEALNNFRPGFFSRGLGLSVVVLLGGILVCFVLAILLLRL